MTTLKKDLHQNQELINPILHKFKLKDGYFGRNYETNQLYFIYNNERFEVEEGLPITELEKMILEYDSNL